jgi:hypothetical protein
MFGRLLMTASRVVLLLTAACGDPAPTGTATRDAPREAVAPTATPNVTLQYACGWTFRVQTNPFANVTLASIGGLRHSGAYYQPRPSLNTYAQGEPGDGVTSIAVFQKWPPGHPGTLAQMTSSIVPCATSSVQPAPGTFALQHVCANGWVVVNRNPVAYRMFWGAGPIGAIFPLDVPAADATGPARLYFGTKLELWRTVRLYFGDEKIAEEPPPDRDGINRRCRPPDPD